MVADYCTRFGLTPKRIQSLLQSVGLDSGDLPLAGELQERVIAPSLDRITDGFYENLVQMEEARDILRQHASLVPLKESMRSYLGSLGVGFDQSAYFESRLQVGLAHVRNAIPLTVYIFAYRMLERLILENFPADLPDVPQLRLFLTRIMTLDMSLAAETYHRARVHELEESLEEMQYEESYLRLRANSDSLTGLPNHERGLGLLDEAWHRSRGRRPLCVMMADLDHFKAVNDEHGHVIGDSVLRECAARIRAAIRRRDKLSRYGGEEFLLILEDTATATATEVAQRILERMSAAPIKVNELAVPLTISIGICEARADDDIDALVACADDALYQAKDAGRNQWIVYDHDAAGD